MSPRVVPVVMRTALDGGILERHLDLRPLRGRRRGVLRCIFHRPDRHGSLSVDLDRGVFNCFACGAQGGLKRFGELVGEHVGMRRRTAERPRGRPELEDARPGVLLWPLADVVRQRARAAQVLRALGTRLGAAHPATWPLLSHAARLERDGWIGEAALDGILAAGRLP